MFIAILDLSTTALDRPAALAQLHGEQTPIRAMSGCIGFRVFAAGDNDTDLTVLHEWADEASFTAYLASDAFERSGAVLRPLMSRPPVSRRFRAELAETV
ncbi:MAG: putative antibiotic biosynthesis monooxygenase [Ilumatobacteraceae bacterium]|nr:putative antibiotic biosynthesis monooxygenase [Ilumatobacteraceae bacterium]